MSTEVYLSFGLLFFAFLSGIGLFVFGHIANPEETSQVHHIGYNEIDESESWNGIE